MLSGSATSLAMTKAKSDYTSIDYRDKKCRLIEKTEHAVVRSCPAFAGYQIERTDWDWAQLSVLYGKNNYAVSYLGHDLGSKAEWRYRQINNKKVYHGLIFRVLNLPMDTDTGIFMNNVPKIERLVVVRLNKEKSCILGVLPTSNDMNEKARALADNPQAECVPE